MKDMSTFREADHPRGGNPGNPGQFSVKTHKEAECSLDESTSPGETLLTEHGAGWEDRSAMFISTITQSVLPRDSKLRTVNKDDLTKLDREFTDFVGSNLDNTKQLLTMSYGNEGYKPSHLIAAYVSARAGIGSPEDLGDVNETKILKWLWKSAQDQGPITVAKASNQTRRGLTQYEIHDANQVGTLTANKLGYTPETAGRAAHRITSGFWDAPTRHEAENTGIQARIFQTNQDDNPHSGPDRAVDSLSQELVFEAGSLEKADQDAKTIIEAMTPYRETYLSEARKEWDKGWNHEDKLSS